MGYSFECPVDRKMFSCRLYGKKVKMCPRVTLLSALLRAMCMGLKCPPDMQFTSLKMANLAGATLSSIVRPSDLSGSFLRGSVLAGCHLRRVELRGACMFDIRAQKANLEQADPTGAIWEGDRRHVNLRQAVLKDCEFGGGDRWDPAPKLPPQHTYTPKVPKPLGIFKMVMRSIAAAILRTSCEVF